MRIKRCFGLYIILFLIFIYKPLEAQVVTTGEYFFDNDPGVGQGRAIVISSSSTTVSITDSVAISGLASGYHRFCIRYKNSLGKWSHIDSRLIYIKSLDSKYLVTAEYFFDADPGIGKASLIRLKSLADTINLIDSINVSGLSPGNHRLSIRYKDSSGVWSHTDSRFINIQSLQSRKLVAAEYFFDNDPGISKSSLIRFKSPADAIYLIDSINVTGLSPGNHRLSLRYKDSSGVWSHIDSRFINIQSLQSRKLVAAEYFFDIDQGIGNATLIRFKAPADAINLVDSINISGISPGNHRLSIRYKDSSSVWSHVDSRFINVQSNTNRNLVAAEYFFDIDKGVGRGIRINPDSESDSLSYIESITSNIIPGFHKICIRYVDGSDVWGHGDASKFEQGLFNIAIYPPNNSPAYTLIPTMIWKNLSAVNNYMLQLSTDSSFNTNLLVNQPALADTTFPVSFGTLNYGTRYYWRIKAYNSTDTTHWSETYNFLTLYPPPILISPVNCAFAVTLANLYLDWTDVLLSTNYLLQVSKTTEFDSLVINDSSVTNSNYTIHSGILDSNHIYYWRVLTFFGKNYSEWSLVKCFTHAPQLICLDKGWNLVSSFMVPGNNILTNFLSQLVDQQNLVFVKSRTENMYFPYFGINTLTNWDSTQSYFIYVLKPTAWSLFGKNIQPQITSISLQKGWNYVAYLRTSPMAAGTALSSISSSLLVARNGNGEMYYPAGSVNSLEQGTANEGKMVPGKGYLIYVTKAATLVYPGN
jgi:hypothetical protein